MPISTLINKADIEKVSEGMLNVKVNHLPMRKLLSPYNPLLCSDPGNKIKTDTSLTVDSIKEYMSVSTFVHTIDGWSYLNNAITAYLNGEPSIAIHLSYYAELRAALAFLCTEGILVANNDQVCIDSLNNPYIPNNQPSRSMRIKNGTHIATWEIIKEWINNISKPTNILEYFTYRGRTFKTLIPYIPHSSTTNPGQATFVKNWLKTWCFDIQKYEEDKTGRNASSYNPNINRSFNPSNLKDGLGVLNEFWKLLEPSTDSFLKIDQYLLALYLNEVYRSSETSISKDNFIKDFYRNSGLSEDNILTHIFINEEESILIKHAKDHQINSITGDVQPLTIIARTILLLRFCSGACSFLFKKNRITKDDLDFYINKVGQDYGMWDTTNPTDLKDLWTDINDLLLDFENYFKTNTPNNILNLKSTFIEYSDIYTQFSRAGLWGFGL